MTHSAVQAAQILAGRALAADTLAQPSADWTDLGSNSPAVGCPGCGVGSGAVPMSMGKFQCLRCGGEFTKTSQLGLMTRREDLPRQDSTPEEVRHWLSLDPDYETLRTYCQRQDPNGDYYRDDPADNPTIDDLRAIVTRWIGGNMSTAAKRAATILAQATDMARRPRLEDERTDPATPADAGWHGGEDTLLDRAAQVTDAQNREVEVGAPVRYAGKFLRSIGAYTGAMGQARGTIVSLDPPEGGSFVIATVDWGAWAEECPGRVNIKNLVRGDRPDQTNM